MPLRRILRRLSHRLKPNWNLLPNPLVVNSIQPVASVGATLLPARRRLTPSIVNGGYEEMGDDMGIHQQVLVNFARAPAVSTGEHRKAYALILTVRGK
jgi:hypothetical protein